MMKQIQSTFQRSLTAALLVLYLVVPGSVKAQDLEVLCDWEDDGTCWSWDFSDGATTFAVVDNPLVDGINTSAKVQQFTTDPASGFPIFLHDYAANNEPAVDLSAWPVYKLKVYTEVSGAFVLLKFEDANNVQFQEVELPVTPGSWQELVFEFSPDPNVTNPLIKMVIFPNFLTRGAAGDWYFDDLIRAKVVNTAAEEDAVPTSFVLEQNYPNPFNPTTTIRYMTEQAGPVNLTVYNLLGEEVATVVDQVQSSGEHVVTFDAGDLPSGVYLYRLSYGNQTSTRSMLLVK